MNEAVNEAVNDAVNEAMNDAVNIDGSRGEGGGQVLRTSLALSMVTGKPLAMRNIRAGRAKPGLRRQHLACVEAAARVCNATVHGASVGSKYLEFTPATGWAEMAGDRDLMIDIGTMGSTTLVVQTIILPAIAAGHSLRATIAGGTHNPMAPPFEFLDRVFLPRLHAMGAEASVSLERHGFVSRGEGGVKSRGEYRSPEADPRGERGLLTLAVGKGTLRPIEVLEAGAITARRATVLLCRLPSHVAERELAIVRSRLKSPIECEVVELRGDAPANVLMIEVDREHGRELVTGFGEKGVRAELIAERACDAIAAYATANVPIGEHLADQLLLPMALARGGRFRCAPLSLHATTNVETIQHFLDVPILVEPDGDAVIVSVG